MINFNRSTRSDFLRDTTNLSNSKSSAQQRNSSTTNTNTPVSAIGEKKRLKVQFIQNNPNTQTFISLQIHPITWPTLQVNDLIEIGVNSNPNITNLNTSLCRNASNFTQLSSSVSNNPTPSNTNQTTNHDDDSTPFFLQVVKSSFNESIPIDTIRIDQAASAAPFSIKNLAYTHATIVDQSTVTLQLVELIFKEQYLNGYDMLRIKTHLENTIVHVKKNIEFCSIRCSVKDLWARNGEIVTCGYIGGKTRLVFRSQSAMCLIYIQMSREMWEFDVNGEMYHEIAINFLGELFANWKSQSCTHDVTIALFSRLYYDAKSIDEFPASINHDIKKDHKDRFYEDFFRVVYQNERYEDWTPTLIILKRLIKEYRDYVLNYHRSQLDLSMPDACLSSAAEGNFLQTLNLSSSVFERHFIDRPFDRTGMMSLVITPGNGLYEVSKELAKITKERVIDNGIGSDLVCLGEQPLHPVPLFKYESKDEFDLPNWINLSFYKSCEMLRYCNSSFLPTSKIKLKNKKCLKSSLNSDQILPGYSNLDKNTYLASFEETDNMFVNQSNNLNSKLHSDSFSASNGRKVNTRYNTITIGGKPRRFNASPSNLSTATLNSTSTNDLSTSSIDHDNEYDNDSSLEFDSDVDQVKQDDDSLSGLGVMNKKLNGNKKAKINPFMPSSIKNTMSSQRRPWAHIFPLRNDGTPIFPNRTAVKTFNEFEKSSIVMQPSTKTFAKISHEISRISPDSAYSSQNGRSLNLNSNLDQNKSSVNKRRNLSLSEAKKSNWEASNFDESMDTMKTGVAWKSLTTPACLPLTTDYVPSEKTWHKKFSCSSYYSLMLDDIREEYGYSISANDKISMAQVFIELVGHRLAMGFQIVVSKNMFTNTTDLASTTTPISTNNPTTIAIRSHPLTSTLTPNFICDLSASWSVLPRDHLKTIKGYYKLSLGRIFHELFYIVDSSNKTDVVNVEIYVPKKIKQIKQSIEYKYRFQVPDSKTYDISYCKMCRKSTESVKWNDIDRYISIQGNGSLTPSELEKCWRQRLYLVPIMYVSNKSITKTELNQNQDSPSQSLSTSLNSLNFTNLTQAQIPASMIQNPSSALKCDIFARKSNEELKFIRDYYFLKFMEGLNKLNRADDKRVYSKATLSYLEIINSLNNLQDQIVAVSAITSALTQINNANSTILNLTRNQLVTLPVVNQRHQQNVHLAQKLKSPKMFLYPKILSFLESKNDSILQAEIFDYLNTEYKIAMLNASNGIPCIQNKNDIPLNCFISAEAVWWCIDHVSEVESEADAILLMQIMSDFGIIRHISNQQTIYIHGFYLYYIITEDNRNHHLYTKDYCEVGFCDIESVSSSGLSNNQERCSLVAVKDILPESINTLPVPSKDLFESYLNLFKTYSKSKFNNMTPDAILKLVNVDVDPARRSNRVEWASAVYRSHYHQLCAFELEVQWEVATGSLLSELVSGWSKLANRFNYHIVPAPIDPFAMPLVLNSDPLRGPIYIGLNMSCLINSECVLFQDIVDEKYRHCLDELFSDRILGQQNMFKFDSSSSSLASSASSASLSTTTSTTMLNIVEANLNYLHEHAPEFLIFLNKKHEKKAIDRRLQDDSEFLRQEFLEFVEYERIIRLIYFQEAVLEKFGFVRNTAVVKTLMNNDNEYATFFIHASGGMFVYIPNYYNNYSTRSRHSSSANTNLTLMNDSSVKSSSIVLNKTNEALKSELESSFKSKRDRLLTQTSDDLILLGTNKEVLKTGNGASKNTSEENSNKTSFNPSLNNSYVSSSNLIPNTSAGSAIVTRERSNTKSQHIEFLRLNVKNYSSAASTGVADNNSEKCVKTSESNEDVDRVADVTLVDLVSSEDETKKSKKLAEVKNDLLFKPNSCNLIKNEKIDQVQHQHQKEQMLLQRFANSTNSTYQKYLLQKDNRKIPFYADTEQFVGFFWSWNFMLGKRWRSQYTGDELFQDNMLSDFRLFCSNQDGRLEKFFRETKELLK